ncbi:hypothetical protein F4777DRAFT_589617 [Nemania sp. FL0916]|nr:hypothetical protein F4777DRAFT_589617 [Nemania sp. FL0916]
MEKPELIKTFHRDDFNENMLPIEHEGSKNRWSVKSRFNETSNTASDMVLQKVFAPPEWRYTDVDNFCETNQWHFFPLVFTQEKFRYEIPSDMRLPYAPATKKAKTAASNNSRVQMRSIYAECFKSSIQTSFDDDKNFCVAVKKLFHSDEQEAEKEAVALENMRNSPNAHLIKAIAYIRTKPRIEHSFVFPWAEYGNLWDFWISQDSAPRDREYFIRVFRQLTCLACAINELSENRTRHGDLKPENIVCFEADGCLPAGDDKKPDATVRLVIIDVGLAKKHNEHTQLRAKTDTRVSTRRYAPPELDIGPEKSLSRRFDVWSLGCIFLEFAIWLLGGKRKLLEFTNGPSVETEKFKFFDTSYERDSIGGPRQIAKRHSAVNKLISEMQNNPLCANDTAIRRLIDLVSDRMLVVDLSGDEHPKPKTENQSACKCVRDVHPLLSRSAEKSSSSGQESIPEQQPSAQPPPPEIFISRAPTMHITGELDSARNGNTSKPGRTYARYIKEELESILADLENGEIDAIKSDDKATKLSVLENLNDDWEYTPDGEIAKKVFDSLELCPSLTPSTNIPSNTLCERCHSLKLWSSTCSFSDSITGLENKANHKGCELCRLLLQSMHDRASQPGDKQIHFIRAGSHIAQRDNRKQVVANLCTTSLTQNIFLRDVQIGLQELPTPASDTHFQILNEWIADCDRNHECYPKADAFVPTRLLDIRNKNTGTIQLLVNEEPHAKVEHYATLSHRWVSSQQHAFCTYKSNIEKHKHSIQLSDLPHTFQDAVRIASGLGLQYLWIDSLCIVQDDPDDWQRESKLMERVFSSAYFTIAATCSFGSGDGDGFLKPRKARQSVTMRGPPGSDAPYFVCEAIDDFARDVEQSDLNQRGWVLQERALSRRTIYFTKRQSYWECGGGVRYSRKASFLGDPNFPQSADQSAKGLKIDLFQHLYERYSELALSYPSDRPIAIRGLESRLINTFGTSGDVGIFQIFLHRSLLWQRAGNTFKRVMSFRDAYVPSWSWTAYEGPIRYLKIPFGEVTWNKDIISPFSRRVSENAVVNKDLRGDKSIEILPLELEAPVWNLLGTEGGDITMDDPRRAFDRPIRCVVLGKTKAPQVDGIQRYWVLFVYPKTIVDDTALYERVGVGVLKNQHIAFDRPHEKGTIQ